MTPYGFSWIEHPYLAAMGFPSPEDFSWLRDQGIDIVLSLTEDAPHRSELNNAGLMNVHIPVPDMSAPTMEQLHEATQTIDKARNADMGVVVHCLAGKGRTGTILAAFLVTQGLSAEQAIARVRQERPGSIESYVQEAIIHEWERKLTGR